ncbi:MAG TPA: DUF1553 domain-containing protein [Pirellulaceae bacterium]|nr:DUF1553 domain-containing protein [Pirellulaceae bacterium]
MLSPGTMSSRSSSPLDVPVRLTLVAFLLLVASSVGSADGKTIDERAEGTFAVAPFSIDVTIPVDHRCMGILPTKSRSVADPLRADGFVLLGGERPIVIVAVDWCEIRNGAYDRMRRTLAEAAGTTIDRVVLSANHQHDAPVVDSDAESLLREVGLPNEPHDVPFFDDVLERLDRAVRDAMLSEKPITHLGLGRATVERIASNRRVVEPDGSISFRRGSRSAADPDLVAADEGEIDPELVTLLFCDGDRPIVAYHTYAVHPMSRYGEGIVSADFVGLARERVRRDDFSVHQIYASGCSGDVTAGRYNDGSDEAREGLIERLADAMRRSIRSAERVPLSGIDCRSVEIRLPWPDDERLSAETLDIERRDPNLPTERRILAAMGLASLRRVERNEPIAMIGIDLATRDERSKSEIGESESGVERIAATLLLFPGESFVGHQLAAKRLAPDRLIAAVGYGESRTGYVPTEAAFADGFDEGWTWTGPGSEAVLRRATAELLQVEPEAIRADARHRDDRNAVDAISDSPSSTLHPVSLERAEPVSIDFARDIRPLLSDRCWRCHGTDEGTREGGLRLDSFDAAVRGGDSGPAIVPGDPTASQLLQRIRSHDDDRMPPEEAGPPLDDAAIAKLAAWIESGAEYAEHWSFRPLVPPQVPVTADDGWSREPLDPFVLRRQRAAGLSPSESAERSVLARRLSLDLLGLPPDVESVERFERDERPDAWERLIDRTLASPHFGERWGRHWLDQARYADTNGYSVDAERTMWPYRDWVIAALNADLPFDRFTIEQLAGDLLPDADDGTRLATGFHRNTLINQEGGTDNEQFRVETVVDRVNTTGAVWLGLTVGCAQCHSHKYDPVTLHDYYRLYAFFDSTRDVNDVGPTIAVPEPAQSERLALVEGRLAAAKSLLERFDREHPPVEMTTGDDGSDAWIVATSETPMSDGGTEFVAQQDGSWLARGPAPPSDRYVIRLKLPTELTNLSAIRLETLTDPSLPQQGPGRAGNGNFVLSELQLLVGADDVRVPVAAIADHAQPNYPVTAALDGDLATGWAINLAPGDSSHGPLNSPRTALFAFAEPIEPPADGAVELVLRFGPQPAGYSIGRFRVSVTDRDPRVLGLPDPERESLVADVERFETERRRLVGEIPRSMVMAELAEPRASTVLIRGDFLRRGDPVEPGTPNWLPPLMQRGARADRLDLARWLVSDRQPLVPRVATNRIWMRLFGEGLVETENDFGSQGSPPTHPELLDHLATTFRNDGWSTKQLLRRIVRSATYRQSSRRRDEVTAADPTGRLLATQRRVRVEAEIVRDLALAVSDALVRRIGGPGVHPPQPAGIYAFTQRNVAWPESRGADRYRRGLYVFFVRGAPYPLLTTFDAPKFETTCTRRVRSNTPLQALTLANDPAFLELAGIAGSAWTETTASDEARIETAWRTALARRPSAAEVARFARFVAAERTLWATDPEASSAWLVALGLDPTAFDERQAIERATWSSVARALFNLDEFITRE